MYYVYLLNNLYTYRIGNYSHKSKSDIDSYTYCNQIPDKIHRVGKGNSNKNYLKQKSRKA